MIEFMPAILVSQFVIPSHDPKSGFRKAERLVEHREILGILVRSRAGKAANRKSDVLPDFKGKKGRVDVISSDDRGQIAIASSQCAFLKCGGVKDFVD